MRLAGQNRTRAAKKEVQIFGEMFMSFLKNSGKEERDYEENGGPQPSPCGHARVATLWLTRLQGIDAERC
jgi:hypothetical protein